MSRKTYVLHGPPGTGKTHALSTVWVPRAVQLHGADRVVICSLTRTAAREIASRVADVPKDHVGTLHALAYRQLGCPTIAESKVDEWNQQAPAHWQLSAGGVDVDDVESRDACQEGDATMAEAQRYRHRRTPLELWPPSVRFFHESWLRWCDEHDYVDFTALIEQALLHTHSAPGNPGMLIMDEAQDASLLELSLLQRWARHCDLVLCGDADQAIYEWRGADPEHFLAPPGGVSEEDQRELLQSYRCPSTVQTAALAMLAEARGRPVPWRPRDAVGAAVREFGVRYDQDPVRLAEAVESFSGRGSVMVLSSCGYMLYDVLSALRDHGVLVHNPYKTKRGDWNPCRGGIKRARAFLKPTLDKAWTWKDLWLWVEHCKAQGLLERGAKAEIQTSSKLDSQASLVVEQHQLERLFTTPGLDSLRTAMSGDEMQALAWLRSTLLPRRQRMYDYATAVARRRGAAALYEEPNVIVGTIHSVKGGQADTVFLSPDLSPSAAAQWGLSQRGANEIRRMFYVGMTRARERLYLCDETSYNHVRWPIS